MTDVDPEILARLRGADPAGLRTVRDGLLRQREAADVDARRERWGADLRSFLFEGLHRHFDRARGLSRFHLDLHDTVRAIKTAVDPIRRADLAPRGGGKTTFASFGLPLAMACDPDEYGIRYAVIIRAKWELAAQRVEAVRNEIEHNADLRAVYGDLRPLPEQGRAWRRGQLETRTGFRLEAVGADQAVRGLLWTDPELGSIRPQVGIFDDLDKDAHGPGVRLALRQWVDQASLGLADVAKPMHCLGFGTAISTDCSIWYFATEAPGWHGNVYRAMPELPDEVDGRWREWADVYDADDEPGRPSARRFYEAHRAEMDRGAVRLWDGEPLYRLMEIRHTSPVTYASEKDNNPRDPASSLLQPGALQHWGEPDDAVEDVPAARREVLASVDPSMGAEGKPKRGQDRDYQAIIVAVLDTLARGIVVEADIARRTIREFVARIVDLCVRHAVERCRIEEVAFQGVIGRDIREEAERRGCKTAFVPWLPPPRVTKEDRLRKLESPITMGKILTHRRHGLLNEQLESLRADGSSQAKRDGPDALAMLWDWVEVSGSRYAGLNLSPPDAGRNVRSVGDLGGRDRTADVFAVHRRDLGDL